MDRSAFKIQTHKMFLDTNFNSPNTVLSSIYQNFVEAAMKYYRYAKCMQNDKQPHLDLLKGKLLKERFLLYETVKNQLSRDLPMFNAGTIRDLVDLAFILIKGKHKLQVANDYDCAVSKRQVQW